MILPSLEALDAVTLWVAATHLQTAWQHAPRLAVNAAAPAAAVRRPVWPPADGPGWQ
ncbi:hypothetical protein KME66_19890 [Streptomyces sp. YPW6]|uniref:hypothetical protein n=1 Tax=Streptomyces sp. YPW6 TaxID=2840373 RepID=UPI001C0E6A34|nr:hypothetical protein [Streptomyces sp. YPW6]QWQ45927.1 hypothetical protein KME66_19890 [Streptomyces sp. YPW6]